jgi:hypothetical protein
MEGWKTLGVITIGIALLILYSRYKRFGFLVNDYRTRNPLGKCEPVAITQVISNWHQTIPNHETG